jgi:hypothetical protein
MASVVGLLATAARLLLWDASHCNLAVSFHQICRIYASPVQMAVSFHQTCRISSKIKLEVKGGVSWSFSPYFK